MAVHVAVGGRPFSARGSQKRGRKPASRFKATLSRSAACGTQFCAICPQAAIAASRICWPTRSTTWQTFSRTTRSSEETGQPRRSPSSHVSSAMIFCTVWTCRKRTGSCALMRPDCHGGLEPAPATQFQSAGPGSPPKVKTRKRRKKWPEREQILFPRWQFAFRARRGTAIQHPWLGVPPETEAAERAQRSHSPMSFDFSASSPAGAMWALSRLRVRA